MESLFVGLWLEELEKSHLHSTSDYWRTRR